MTKIGSILILLLIISGCTGTQLTMQNAGFIPEVVSPGNDVLIVVNIEDSEGIIVKVFATLVHDKNYYALLNDKGTNGDEVAGDGLWSSSFDVPWNAPDAVYEWKFEAFTATDAVIIVTDDGSEIPLTERASVEVK